jgi:acyl-CoA synthetase (AMP-forming)/AMP-acid ligase II
VTSLVDLLFGGDDDPGSLLLHAGGVDRTLAEVRAEAEALAARLVEAGVGPGAAVAVSLPDPLVVPALFAVWRLGAVYVPLNPRLGATDRAHVLDAARPSAVVTDEGVEARDGGRQYDRDIALVQLTSGTTGRPKPVLLRHSGVLELLQNVIATLRGGAAGPAKPAMPNLIPVSLSLWAGIYQVLFARLVGAPVVVMDGFEPLEFARLVDRFQIRSTVLPPAAMAMLSDEPRVTTLEPLRYVRSITAPLSPLQARRFRDRFGLFVLNCYGQTEIGGEIIGWSGADAKEHGDDKLGAVGRPHAGVEVRTDTETGELQVRTPALSAGYADGADLSDRLTDDGWFRTGDIGHQDDEGFVWSDVLMSDLVIRGGLKVFPGEVEEVLRLSPDVADVAVVGAPDDRLGEVPWAFVVGSASPGELEALCREHLAPYKVPTRFVAVDALPRNDVGKVLRPQLLAADCQQDPDHPPQERGI